MNHVGMVCVSKTTAASPTQVNVKASPECNARERVPPQAGLSQRGDACLVIGVAVNIWKIRLE